MIITVDIHAGPRASIRWDRELSDPSGGTISVIREVLGSGGFEVVQGLEGIPNTAGVAPDWTVPLRRPVRYGVRHSTGVTWWSDPITVDADRPVLIEPLRGGRATVTVASWTEYATQTQTRDLSVPGRPEGITLPGVEETPTSTIELLTFTREEREALDAILATGQTLRLRGWATVEDTWLSVRDRSTSRFTPHNLHSETRSHALQVKHTTMPDPHIRAVAVTLGDLHDYMQGLTPGATLEDIHTQWMGTLLDIAADPMGVE